MNALFALMVRDMRIAMRVGGGALMGALFFLIVVTMMPFAIGPALGLLARIGPAILWLGALLASLLALDRLFATDHEDGSLDLLMTKKIGHPENKEYAIGAVGLEDSFIERTHDGIPPGYIQHETARIRQELEDRYKRFMGDRKPLDIQDKTVIVVDDGIATGRTILATLRMLKSRQPGKLIVAAPVASQQAAHRIRMEVDELICLHTPVPFYGVGRFYQDFSQVDDNEVTRLLSYFVAPSTTIP